MTKFKRVLSEDWLPDEFTSGNEIPVFSKMVDRKSLRSIVEQAEKSILEKLAEQEPVAWLILDADGDTDGLEHFCHGDKPSMASKFKQPLYAHPIPETKEQR